MFLLNKKELKKILQAKTLIIASPTKVNHMNENKIAKAPNSPSESNKLYNLKAQSNEYRSPAIQFSL